MHAVEVANCQGARFGQMRDLFILKNNYHSFSLLQEILTIGEVYMSE